MSKGHRVYWKESKTVTVERSVVFKKEEGQIRGYIEDEEDVEIEGEGSTINPNISTTSPITKSPRSPQSPLDTSSDSVRIPRVRKPSQYVQRLLQGTGTTGDSKAILPRGIPQPTSPPSLIPEEMTEEQALLADVSETEGLKPRTVAEAHRLPDWDKWAKAIEEEL
ncbi:hypothetical protein BT96DRAFT_810645, partial [Gymnopus androsaceus JB14]